MHWLTKQLINPDTYSTTIDMYALKQIKKSHLVTQGLEGIAFETLLIEKDELANLLANLFKASQLKLGILNQAIIERNNKKRIIYNSSTLENIVENTILRLLLPKLKEYGMPGLYSFFPGTNPFKTMQAISHKLKQLSGDIYILRTDIVSYTDSIPNDDNSPLWAFLDQFFKWLDPSTPVDAYCYQLIKSRIQAHYRAVDGELKFITKGVPTGRPLSTFIAAIYLRNLDIEMSKIKNGLYVRFGDDIIWLNNNIDDFNYGNNILSEMLTELKLPRNPAKERYFMLTRSGAHYGEGFSEFEGAREVEYLGLSILRSGKIRLSLKNFSKIKKLITQRIKNANRLLGSSLAIEEKIKIMVNMINTSFTQESRLKSSLAMLNIVSDYGQLKELDFFIASRVLMLCTNNYKLKIFRKYSYKWLRNECGLISLCMSKGKR